jgi:hypothetical protein
MTMNSMRHDLRDAFEADPETPIKASATADKNQHRLVFKVQVFKVSLLPRPRKQTTILRALRIDGIL